MPPVLRTRKTARDTERKATTKAGGPVDLLSPVAQPAGSTGGPEPAPDQPPPKKQNRQKKPSMKQTAGPPAELPQTMSSSRGRASASSQTAQAADQVSALGSTEQAKATQQPPWKKQQGVKRVMAEFHAMCKQPGTQLSHMEMVDDNALTWYGYIMSSTS